MARCPMSCFVERIAPPPDVTTYGGDQVKRREFVTLLGGDGVASALPLVPPRHNMSSSGVTS